MKTCASLFAGGGGWEVGAIASGLTPVWSVELNPEIAGVYDAYVAPRFPRHRTIVGSVLDVDPARLPRVDVLFASPPCQGYSAGRNRPGLEERCDLDVGLDVVRYVAALAPRVVLLENVVNYAKSAVFKDLVARLRALGYAADAYLLNGYDYRVPSRRHRMIARFKRGGALPPMPPPMLPRVGWYAALADLIPTFKPAKLAAWQRVRVERQLAARALPFPLLISSYNVASAAFKRGEVVRVATPPGEPAGAVVATSDAMSATRILFADGSVREVNTRGFARLMSFPDAYGLPADKELATRVVGNAVPPALAAAMLAPFLR